MSVKQNKDGTYKDLYVEAMYDIICQVKNEDPIVLLPGQVAPVRHFGKSFKTSLALHVGVAWEDPQWGALYGVCANHTGTAATHVEALNVFKNDVMGYKGGTYYYDVSGSALGLCSQGRPSPRCRSYAHEKRTASEFAHMVSRARRILDYPVPGKVTVQDWLPRFFARTAGKIKADTLAASLPSYSRIDVTTGNKVNLVELPFPFLFQPIDTLLKDEDEAMVCRYVQMFDQLLLNIQQDIGTDEVYIGTQLRPLKDLSGTYKITPTDIVTDSQYMLLEVPSADNMDILSWELAGVTSMRPVAAGLTSPRATVSVPFMKDDILWGIDRYSRKRVLEIVKRQSLAPREPRYQFC